MRVLHVGLNQTAVKILATAGLCVKTDSTINRVEDVLEWASTDHCDALVVDLDAIRWDINFAKSLRKKGITMLMIIGIMKESKHMRWSTCRAQFLSSGGDDLVRGPVDPEEVIASLKAIERRCFERRATDTPMFRCKGALLVIDRSTGTVTVNDTVIQLSAMERRLLEYFTTNAGRLLTRDQIISRVLTHEAETNTATSLVMRLRGKLEVAHPDARDIILTEHGNGYRMIPRAK